MPHLLIHVRISVSRSKQLSHTPQRLANLEHLLSYRGDTLSSRRGSVCALGMHTSVHLCWRAPAGPVLTWKPFYLLRQCLANPGVHQFWLIQLATLLQGSLPSVRAGITSGHCVCTFYLGSRDRTWILTVVWQACYSLNHLPTPLLPF